MTAPTITTLTLNTIQVGVAFSQQLVATGNAPITWECGWTADATWTVDSDLHTADGYPCLPDGLTLSSTGLLSGTPTTGGAYSFTVTATNAGGSDDQAYTGTVAAESAGTGGWAAYNAYDAERQRRRRKQEQDEEDEREALADRLEAQLAAEGLLEADPVVAQRIVVREYAQSPELLNRRAQRAVEYALRAKTELAWQLAAREIARQEEDEELAVILLLAAA